MVVFELVVVLVVVRERLVGVGLKVKSFVWVLLFMDLKVVKCFFICGC